MIEEKARKERRLQDMNRPASESLKLVFQYKTFQIPPLSIVNMNEIIECYTHLETPREPKVFTID